MKPTQRTKESGISEKKLTSPTLASPTLMAPAASGGDGVKSKPAFGVPPTTAVWNRYIDSRMKHFGTR